MATLRSAPSEQSPAQERPPRVEKRRPYGRHGLHARKRRVAVAGMDAIDRRTLGGRELVGWWENQIAHLGGKDEISHPELTLSLPSTGLWCASSANS